MNKGEPMEYHIDDRSVNTLYMCVAGYYVLVWKLIVNEKMVSIAYRIHWSESMTMNLVWITIIFFATIYAMYLTTKMSANQYQWDCLRGVKRRCSLGEACDTVLQSTLMKRRTQVGKAGCV